MGGSYWLRVIGWGYGIWDMGYGLTVRGLRACGVREQGVRGWALRGAVDGRGWGLVHGLGGVMVCGHRGLCPYLGEGELIIFWSRGGLGWSG